MSKTAYSIFERMRVPDHKNIYVLGCFERPATVYMQQVRALNLIYALQQEFPDASPRIGIVGAGAAGATASAAAALLGWDVTILDKHANDILSLAGSSATHRWLHPHIYDWPEDDKTDARAGLCILDWAAGPADQVVSALRAQWQPIRKAKAINTYLGAQNVVLEPLGAGYYLQWNSYADDDKSKERRLFGQKFDVIILAVGFGVEESSDSFKPVSSYWVPDNLHGNAVASDNRYRVLVSGTGDGGLIDVLRFAFNEFRHERILQQLQDQWLAPGQYEVIRERLKEIEAQIRPLFEAGKPYQAMLNHAYHELIASLKFKQEIARRTEVQPVLTGVSRMPLTLEAAPINRFLFALAQIQYIPGPLRSALQAAPDGKWTVDFEGNEKPQDYDRVIIRHGPSPILARDFPDIYAACMPIKAKVGPSADPTRFPLYSAEFARRLSDASQAIMQNDGAPLAAIRAAVSQHASDSVINRWIATLKGSLRQLTEGAFAHYIERSVTPAVEGPPARAATGADMPGRQQVKANPEWLLKGAPLKIVVGVNGSGKSTLLRVLHAALADDATSVPLMASRQHMEDYEQRADSPERLVRALIDDACGLLEPAPTPTERTKLQDRLHALVALGRAVLFLPETEHAHDSAERRCDLMLRLQRIHPGIRIVTASRDAGAMTRRLPASTYLLEPLSHRDVERLLSSRQAYARGAVAPALLDAIPALLGRVSTPQQLLRLLDTPLLNRGSQELYPWIVATVGEQFQHQASATAEVFTTALGEIACQMLEAGHNTFTVPQLEAVFQPPLPPGAARQMLTLLSESLVVAVNADLYGFALPILLDCVAAQFIVRRTQDPENKAFALALNAGLAASEAAPMIIGQIASGGAEVAAGLLRKMAALPESLDWQILTFRIRSLRYIRCPVDDQLPDIVQSLSHIVANNETSDEPTLQKLGAACYDAKDRLGAPVMSALDAILRQDAALPSWRAVQFLRHARLPGAVPAIGRILATSGGQHFVHEAAAQALGAIGDDAAIPFLSRAIRVPPGAMILTSAYDALGQIGTPAARDHLIGILENEKLYENYRWPATFALSPIQDAVAQAALLKAATSPMSLIRRSALEALGSQSDGAALPPLLTALNDAEADIRRAAVNALGKLRHPSAIEHLARSMRDRDNTVRAATADALANLDTAVLVRELQSIIADRANTWRGAAASLLAKYQGDGAIDTLQLLAKESSDEVKQGTAHGLRFIRHPAALETLKLLVLDRSVQVREAAAESLGAQDAAQALPLLLSVVETEAVETVRSSALKALRRLPDPASIAVIVRDLERSDASRYDAVLALGAIGTPAITVPMLSAWLAFENDNYLKRIIAGALARMDAEEGAHRLAQLYDAENSHNRSILINYGVRHMDDAAAVPLLLKAMSDPDDELAKNGERALRSLSVDTLVPGLRLSLEDRDTDVRLQATRLSPFYADRDIWQTLQRMADADEVTEIRDAAAKCVLSYMQDARTPTSSKLGSS